MTYACNGAPGDKGETGDAAGGHVYSDSRFARRSLSTRFLLPSIAGELEVPRPGSYLVMFKIRMEPPPTHVVTAAQCELVTFGVNPNERIWDRTRVEFELDGNSIADIIVMHAAVQLDASSEGLIQARCHGGSSVTFFDMSNSQLTALRVDGIN